MVRATPCLDPKQLGNKTLSPVELEALSSFLAANVSAFAMDLIANPNPNPDPKPKPDPNPNPNQVSAFAMDLIAPAVLQELLGRAAVRIVEDDPASIPALSLEPSASRQGGAATTPLYRRGQQCGHCTVVLQGRLHIFCGEEGFESDRGPWTVLGAQSLQDEHYVADFSATPMERSRVLQISYADYQVGAPTGLPRSLACHTYLLATLTRVRSHALAARRPVPAHSLTSWEPPNLQVALEHHRALLDMNAPVPSSLPQGVITSSLPRGADGPQLQPQHEPQLEAPALLPIAPCAQQAAGPSSSEQAQQGMEQGRLSPGVTPGAARKAPQRKKCQVPPGATRPSAGKLASAPAPVTDNVSNQDGDQAV